MKMEERDRLIREEAMQKGLAQGAILGRNSYGKTCIGIDTKTTFSDLERCNIGRRVSQETI